MMSSSVLRWLLILKMNHFNPWSPRAAENTSEGLDMDVPLDVNVCREIYLQYIHQYIHMCVCVSFDYYISCIPTAATLIRMWVLAQGQKRFEPCALQLETPPTLFLLFCSCCHCQQFGVQMAALASGRCGSCQMNFKRNILGSQRCEPSRQGDHVLC